MPRFLKLFQRQTRDGKAIWHYRGTIDGHRLRGTTGTADRKEAIQITAKIEREHNSGALRSGKGTHLRFPKAVACYLKADKSDQYIGKIEDYWKNTKVRDMTAGAIRQSAIDMYPGCSGATWNRQVITPTQAVINHCAELELCAPIRVRRFKFEAKIKKPMTLAWLNTFCEYARPVIKALVLDMFATGCRFSEAHRQEWPDINFKDRTILIRDTKTKKQRIAHIPGPLLVALANLPRDKAPFYWSETELRRQWNEDVAKAVKAVDGFERLTFHCCRHGFATKMLRDGVDPKTAATLGGWDDIGLFMKTYAHAMEQPDLTEGLFDTQTDTREADAKEIKGL